MTVTVKVVLDSISPDGIRLPTIQYRAPRMIHADFLTHRVFSRNGRSSRAVPITTLLKEEPYTPAFARNQPGMVAGEPLTGLEYQRAQDLWLYAAQECKNVAKELSDMKVHKQWGNRMLEWFGYIDVLLTSTDLNNFYALRDDEGAQPEIQELARGIKEALDASTPKLLLPGQWHMPYVDLEKDAQLICDYKGVKSYGELKESEIMDIAKKLSVARCARLTIKPFDGDSSIEKELARYEKLMVSRPVHASPAEHVATPDTFSTYMLSKFGDGGFLYTEKKITMGDHEEEWGNFNGWRQFRKQIPHNTVY